MSTIRAADIPVRANGQNVIASWWNLLRSALLNAPQIEVFQKTYSQFSTAGLTNTLDLVTMAARDNLFIVGAKPTTAFAGTGITALTLEVGLAGDADAYIGNFDLLAAVADTNFINNTIMLPFFASTTLKVKATAVGANLNQLTQGVVEIWVARCAIPTV